MKYQLLLISCIASCILASTPTKAEVIIFQRQIIVNKLNNKIGQKLQVHCVP